MLLVALLLQSLPAHSCFFLLQDDNSTRGENRSSNISLLSRIVPILQKMKTSTFQVFWQWAGEERPSQLKSGFLMKALGLGLTPSKPIWRLLHAHWLESWQKCKSWNFPDWSKMCLKFKPLFVNSACLHLQDNCDTTPWILCQQGGLLRAPLTPACS